MFRIVCVLRAKGNTGDAQKKPFEQERTLCTHKCKHNQSNMCGTVTSGARIGPGTLDLAEKQILASGRRKKLHHPKCYRCSSFTLPGNDSVEHVASQQLLGICQKNEKSAPKGGLQVRHHGVRG